jgi:hypothetical protein
MRRAVFLLVAVLACAAPASAHAARPFKIGTGNQPGVAVGSRGEAHVAWKRELGGRDILVYCRVPKGARHCAVRHKLSLGDRSTTGDAIVLAPSPGVVHLLVAGGGSERGALFTSTNDGATFAGPFSLGELFGIRAAVMKPAGGFTLITDFMSVRVARYGLNGAGPAEAPVRLGDGTERAIAARASLPVAFFVDSAHNRLHEFAHGGGDPNVPAAWHEGPRIKHVGAVAAAGGKRGLWVGYTHRRSFHRDVTVTRLGRTGYGRKRTLNRGDDPLWVQLAQGGSGLVASWSTHSRVRYRSSRTGRRWSPTRTLFTGHHPEELRLALGRRGGWMAWDGNELNAGNETVRLVPVPRPR